MRGDNLDLMYPFDREYYDESNDIVSEKDWHYSRLCTCRLTTRRGSYRYVIINKERNILLHYLHQHCIAVEDKEKLVLSSCGFRTKITKDYLDGILPTGYCLVQRDYTWYITNYLNNFKGGTEFYNGIELTKDNNGNWSV